MRPRAAPRMTLTSAEFNCMIIKMSRSSWAASVHWLAAVSLITRAVSAVEQDLAYIHASRTVKLRHGICGHDTCAILWV